MELLNNSTELFETNFCELNDVNYFIEKKVDFLKDWEKFLLDIPEKEKLIYLIVRQGFSIKETSTRFNVSRSYLYRIVSKFEKWINLWNTAYEVLN